MFQLGGLSMVIVIFTVHLPCHCPERRALQQRISLRKCTGRGLIPSVIFSGTNCLLLLLLLVVLLVVHPMLMTKWARMLLVGMEIDGGMADGRPSVERIVVLRQGEDAGVDAG
jgi:hypothetical protein